MSRPAVPAALKRQLFEESGYRCAIPTCRSTSVLEMAHIVDRATVQEDTFENMIVLCAMCHGLYDREGKIPKASVLAYKANLGLVNGRYSDFERRLFDLWYRQGLDTPIELEVSGSSRVNTLNVIADGLVQVNASAATTSTYRAPNGGIIVQLPMKLSNPLPGTPRASVDQGQRIGGTDDYRLTDKGKSFIRKYYSATEIE